MKRYLIYISVGLSLLIVSISGTAVSVAFPDIISSFDTTLILASWVLGIAQLANTIAMPLVGKACDIFGRKTIFILCTVLFTTGSLASALAPNIGLLIFFRLIQSVGAGGFLPAATAIVAEEFPKARQQSIGFFSTIFPIGQILGPSIGGWLVTQFGWKSTFWMSVPLGVLVFVVGILLLRNKPGESSSKIDTVGAGLLCATVSAIMIGISMLGEGQSSGFRWIAVMLFGMGVIFGILFFRRQTRVADPIIDVQVLREKHFLATNLYNFFYGIAVLGVFSFIPLFAVSVFNMSTLESGLVLMPRSIAMIIASIVISMTLVRFGYRWPIAIGTILTAASLFGLALQSPGIDLNIIYISGSAILIMMMLFAGFSQGMIAPAANNACIELMPERIGTITGVRGMFRQVGSVFSVNITALVVQNTGDMAKGFYYVFLGMAIMMMLTLPLILLIPRGGRSKDASTKATTKGLSL